MILGATATLVLNLGGLFAEGTGLGMPDVAEAINGVIDVIRPGLTQLVFISINLMALLTAILNAYYLGEYYNENYDKNEFDCNDWTIMGEPNTRVVIERPSTVELTCATVINRIVEVLCAEPGYTTTDQMPENIYKAFNLDKYVEIVDDCGCGCDGEHHCHD